MPRFLLLFLLLMFSVIPPILAQSPPTSTVSVSDQSVLGENDWYISTIQFSIRSTDDAAVTRISYKIDDGATTDIAVTPAPSATISFTYSVSGSHTLFYWATDSQGTIEPTRSLPFKVDVQAPGNWKQFTATRSGSEHTYKLSVTLSDIGSGLNPTTAFVQYTVDEGTHWGYYQDPLRCGSLWIENGWMQVDEIEPGASGALSAEVETDSINFCNSNWAVDKKVRFKIKDMAGNESSKVFTLNGSWFRTEGGNVYSDGDLVLHTTGNADNAEALVLSGGSISNFTTRGATVGKYQVRLPTDYATFKTLLSPTRPLPNGKLPQTATAGVYLMSGSLSIDAVTKPSSTAEFTAVVFVEGDVVVKQSFSISPKASLVFIVRDRVLIEKGVEEVAGMYYAGKDIDSSYNGDANKALAVVGSFATLSNIDLSTRSLTGAANTTTPSEVIRFTPWYLINSSLLGIIGGEGSFRWEEIAP